MSDAGGQGPCYIVLRGVGDIYRDGRWHRLPQGPPPRRFDAAGMTFGPTGRFETREDGETAEVYAPILEERPGA